MNAIRLRIAPEGDYPSLAVILAQTLRIFGNPKGLRMVWA